MKTKDRIQKLTREVAPTYPRIPHLDRSISNMTHDDILTESPIIFPITGWVQEKIDGANMGVSWTSGPVIRNRNNILKKGYTEKCTPSKMQFRSAWNWIHEHGSDIRKISKECLTPVTIYGEWMYAKHSLEYDNLPDWFIAYDIYLTEDRKFLSPDIFEKVISKTYISYIKPRLVTFNTMDEIVTYSKMKSEYRNGVREGIVIKIPSGGYISDSYKVVNNMFVRREDFNNQLIKNRLRK